MSKYKGFRINIKNTHLAMLLTDDELGVTYGTIETLPGLMKVSVSPQLASASLYGDGVVRDTTSKTTSQELNVELNKMDYSMLSKYSGKKIVDGVMVDSASDQAPYFAFGFETELRGDKREMLWFLKCTLMPSDRNLEQSTDNVNYSTDSFKITALPLNYNNHIYYLGDTSDAEMKFTETMAETWFDEVKVIVPNATGDING